jgi:hypothetical protein
MLKADKQKYFQILDSQGLSAAITALHHDMREIEFEVFEGAKGYQPELWTDLEDFRLISRELWDNAMKSVAERKA